MTLRRSDLQESSSHRFRRASYSQRRALVTAFSDFLVTAPSIRKDRAMAADRGGGCWWQEL